MIGPLSRFARNHPRANIQCITFFGALLLMSLLLITEFAIVRLGTKGSATERWLPFAGMFFLAGLLGLRVAACAACRSNQKKRDLERRLRSEAESEARRDVVMEDPLTELPNGRALVAALKEAIEHPLGETLAFYLLDLNGFKSVNNAYGAATGDAILRGVALRLRSVARRGDLIARYESDAFAVLARDVGSRREGIDIGQRYVAALDDAISVENRAHVIGVTAGMAFYPEDGTTPEELIHHADLAMRSEKASRKSEMQFFVAPTYAPAV